MTYGLEPDTRTHGFRQGDQVIGRAGAGDIVADHDSGALRSFHNFCNGRNAVQVRVRRCVHLFRSAGAILGFLFHDIDGQGNENRARRSLICDLEGSMHYGGHFVGPLNLNGPFRHGRCHGDEIMT